MAVEEKHQHAKGLLPVPGWLRQNEETSDDTALFRAGAALAMLDTRMRADVEFAGAWRCRLALAAAVASTKQIRRGEDEAQLRDAFYLRSGGSDDPGPGGRQLVAWRALDRSSALSDDALFHVAIQLGVKIDDPLRAAIASAQTTAASDRAAPLSAAEAAARIIKARPDAVVLAWWIADAVLAARLRWPLPLPLLAEGLRGVRHCPRPADSGWTVACCRAYAAASLQACDLFADLARRSDKLIAVAPRLRAKGAAAVVQNLLADDAVPATKPMAAISDRGMRRLFDRLVALGAARELTGRPTFRLYGL